MDPQFYIAKLRRRDGSETTISSEDTDAIGAFFVERVKEPESPQSIISVDIAFIKALPLNKIKVAFKRLAELVENGYALINRPYYRGQSEKIFLPANFLELDYVRVVGYIPPEDRTSDGMVIDVEADPLKTLAPGLEDQIDDDERDEFLNYVSLFMQVMRVTTKKVYIPTNSKTPRKIVFRFDRLLNSNTGVEWIHRLQSLIESRYFLYEGLKRIESNQNERIIEYIAHRSEVKQEFIEEGGDSEDVDKDYLEGLKYLKNQQMLALWDFNRNEILLALRYANQKIDSRDSRERRCNIL